MFYFKGCGGGSRFRWDVLCLIVPTIIDRDGVREVLKLPLEKEEIKQLQNSATILRDIIQSLDLQ